jgi:diguanylate cyclase (GGDEF)-like protein
MTTPLRVVIIEDSPDDAELLARSLRQAGYDVTYERAYDADTLDAALARGPWDVVFSDHSMPEFGSGAALQMVRGRDPDVPFLIVSGTMGEDVAVDAMRAGANDYFVKGRLARLPAVVDRELRQAAARGAQRSLDRTLKALGDVSSAMGRLPEPRALAAIVVRHVRELLRVDAAVLHGWDAEAGVLRPIAVEGIGEIAQLAIHPGEGASGLAFERRETVVVEDVDALARPLAFRHEVKSVIATPLIVSARVIGTLVALNIQPRVFSPDDRHLMHLFASEAAPALEAARLFAEAERQKAEAEALAEAAQLVAAGSVANDTLRSILVAAQRVVPAGGAGLFAESHDRCEVLAGVGSFQSATGRTFAIGSSLLGRVLRSGALQVRADDEPPDESQIVLGAPIALAVPIVRGATTIAALGIAPLRDGRVGVRDADLLRRFGALVSMALENGRLQRDSERHAAELERLAHFDALTGLPNRALFRDRLRDAVSSAHSRPATIFHVDVEHFKDLNDAFGAQIGDALLSAVAGRLGDALGPDVLVARIGGDEFGALVPGDADAARDQAVRIQSMLDRPIAVGDELIPLRVSIGIASSPRDGNDAEQLLSRAEVAVYAAKRGTGVAAYDPKEDAYSPERLALMAQLRSAIDRDELVLHYQPLVDLRTHEAVRAEGLVRWQHPERGLLPPAEVIPLAERAGLMNRLTRWVIGEALRQARRWQDDGIDIAVAVNLPMRTLHDDSLPEFVRERLERAGLAADRLAFEITETDVMSNAAEAIRVLRTLRAMGLRVAIDDFGTGYSSLAYLHQLDVNAVKIDRSFVMHMRDESSRTIVRATIDLAHALRLQVVAEGVEDAETLTELGALGCDFAQGYHLARPMRAVDLTTWLSTWRREHAG